MGSSAARRRRRGDDLLDGITIELAQADGLPRGSFLRTFLATVDYPAGQLQLQRYTTQTWHDEFKRVASVWPT